MTDPGWPATVLAWVGTLTFAAAGASTAIQRRFDLVGVTILASVTAVGGGAVRDVVVGRLPPRIFQDETLLWAVAATALATFVVHRPVARATRLLYVLDGVGLAIFAALGAEAGLDAGLGFWGVVFAGAVSGVGGGVLRDVLTGSVPGILYRSGDFYASAAAAGAAATFVTAACVDAAGVHLLVGTAVTALVRFGSRWLGLNLPVPRDPT